MVAGSLGQFNLAWWLEIRGTINLRGDCNRVGFGHWGCNQTGIGISLADLNYSWGLD